MKTFLKILVAAIVAASMALFLIAHGASGNAVFVTYLLTAVAICAWLGVFDERTKKHASIRDAARKYPEAA